MFQHIIFSYSLTKEQHHTALVNHHPRDIFGSNSYLYTLSIKKLKYKKPSELTETPIHWADLKDFIGERC